MEIGHECLVLEITEVVTAANIVTNAEHVYRRDYPVSSAEMSRILSKVGFEVDVWDLSGTSHPLRRYFSVIAGTKR